MPNEIKLLKERRLNSRCKHFDMILIVANDGHYFINSLLKIAFHRINK